ncbi:MAG: PAS domain S-box protein, partial [Deltaproteobacteria bacterium]|nr:PAS domain S-box protein [Deltaproteobacteria bacterium]
MANGARRAGLGEVTLEFLEATSGRTGRDFFVALARSLSRATGARHAFVGEVEEAIRVRTLGYVRDGAEADDFVYELEHTPCREVTEVGMCLHPRGVAAAFPLDLMLAEMSIESYAGVPLHAGGTCVGILVAIDEAPMEDHSELGPLLALFGRSAGAEIARLRADRERAAEAARRDALTRELAASEARYRAMVTSCAEGVWLIDATGITTFVNPQMARMLGVAEGEMLGRSFFDFMDERARHDAQQNLARWRRGVSETHEFRLTHASGHDVWVLMATSPVNDESGEIVGAQAFVTDVTERRGLELKVQHAQKLESLGVLAGDIAHDFNNLLVGILGNVGLAVRESKAEAPVIPLLTDIQLAAERAADLTRQMLAYSGKGRFVVERLDLNRIVDEMSHLLSTVISKKAALRFQLAAQVPPVEADAVQLRQVVMNLITN